MSVSTGVSVGVSTSKIKSSGDVAATVGDGVSVTAKDVHVAAVTTESLLAKSQASSGALFVAAAGTVSEVDSSLGARSSLGADAKITVKTFEIRATHDPDVDVKADAKTLGLAAGAGGSTDVSLTGDATVGIGQRAVVNADAIIVGAVNKALKNRYANDSNLRSGSAGAASLSALSATTDIGSASDRYSAIVTVGDQAQLLVGGNEANPGQLDISALSSVKAIDNVRIEGVGGYAMSLGEADDDAYTTSRIDLSGATLINSSGDVYVTTRTSSEVRPSTNLFTAAALAGVSGAKSDGTVDAENRVVANNTKIKGATVYLLSGVDKSGQVNLLDGNSAADVTTVSLFLGLSMPAPTLSIVETNRVDLTGSTVVQALGNVYLRAREGLGGDERGQVSAHTLSLSLVPYGFMIDEQGFATSDNQVVVGPNAKVEAALNNQALLWVMPMYVAGTGGALVRQLADGRLGTELTTAEKAALTLDSGIRYEYAALDLTSLTATDSTSTATLASLVTDLTGKFYVIKPVEVAAPKLTIANVQNLLLARRDSLKDWIASHSSNTEAVARYQVQLDQVNQALATLGLTEDVVGPNGTVQVAKKEFDQLFLDLPNLYASPGSIFIEASDTPSSDIMPLTSTRLIARAGAKIDVFNKSPFSMRVQDAVINDTTRVVPVDGVLTTFRPGNVFLNNIDLTGRNGTAGSSTIKIVQDSLPATFYGLSDAVVAKFNGPQDMNLIGSVVNEDGSVVIRNTGGSIDVTGELRAGTVDIVAAGDFNLNVPGWQSIQDPRQYLGGGDATDDRNRVFNEDGTKKLVSFTSLTLLPALQA
ncbi:MAG TPA: hypothetical protein PLV92_14040, partial [Pirellulaceae bacterium]|nr:hypothetical protein [Pirellulaceae bacterium]